MDIYGQHIPGYENSKYKGPGVSRKATIYSLFNQYLLRVSCQWLEIQRHSTCPQNAYGIVEKK